MVKTEAQKKACKKWRENNKDKYNELQNKYTKNYYENNKESRLEYAKQYRLKKKGLLENENIECENI